MASFEPSRRRTEAVASIRPSIGIRSGSLWPPTKLYLGNPAKRGDGSGSPFENRDVRSKTELLMVRFPSGWQGAKARMAAMRGARGEGSTRGTRRTTESHRVEGICASAKRINAFSVVLRVLRV